MRNSLSSVGRMDIAKTESSEAGLTVRPSVKVEMLGAVWRADISNEIRGVPPGGVEFVRGGHRPGTLSVAGDFSIYGPRDLNTLGTIRAEQYERITSSIAYTARDRNRLWLGGFVYPGSRIAEAAFLFNQKVGIRANPRVSLEAGMTHTF